MPPQGDESRNNNGTEMKSKKGKRGGGIESVLLELNH